MLMIVLFDPKTEGNTYAAIDHALEPAIPVFVADVTAAFVPLNTAALG
jgi:hypothetical protein